MPDSSIRSPRVAAWLTRFCLHEVDADVVLGDLEETYAALHRRYGRRAARRWYWSQVLRSGPNFVYRTFYWSLVMWKNYVVASLRKFRRTKVHTLVNVIGLTLGLLCALIIFQKVRYELSFDGYHPDADRVYRVTHANNQFGQTEYDEGVPYPFAEAFRIDFPEVEQVALVDRNGVSGAVLAATRGNGEVVRFKQENGIAFVDQEFFDLFSYEWLLGDPATALTAPYTVVLSESLALKFFGTARPLGQLLNYENRFDLTVTGVVRDAPRNTVLPLDVLISFNLGEEHRRGSDSWSSTSSSVQCYLKLPAGMAHGQIDSRLHDFLAKHRSEEIAEYLRFFLQPLSEIHFDTRFNTIGAQTITARETIWALSLIGLFLLLTACINFVNLNIVLVFKRAREVAMRKVLGGTSGQIMTYFMTETALITLAALTLALVLVNPVMRWTASFIGEGLSANPFTDPILAGVVLLTTLTLSVLSGLYPAFLMSRLHPSAAMRGTLGQKPGAFLTLRRGLVVFQFAISQVLIICTLAAMNQMQHLYTLPLGYDTEAVVEFSLPTNNETTLRTLKNELLQTTAIRHVTYSNSGASSTNIWGSNFYYLKDDERLENETQVKLVDHDYIETYQMTLVAGEAFVPTDSVAGFIVNEALVAVMGYASPSEALGTPVDVWGNKLIPITGVVRNFNTNTLHEAIEATVLIPSIRQANVGAMKVNTAQVGDALAALENAWASAFPEHLFEYVFLDDRLARFYEEEQALQRLIQAFALIAILIGCIGLFGLISYTTSQRAREVGIRKVLGATAPHIVGMFTREFVVFVVLGFALAAPVAYMVMTKWLNNFAYRIDLGVVLFVGAFGVSLVIALLTVGFKTYRSAMANPVDVIRHA